MDRQGHAEWVRALEAAEQCFKGKMPARYCKSISKLNMILSRVIAAMIEDLLQVMVIKRQEAECPIHST